MLGLRKGTLAVAIVFAVAGLVNLSAPVAFAQQVAVAEVTGNVTDPSGQAVAGAQVKMIEADKQQVHATTTDATGRFELPNLPVGGYWLEVTLAGFKTYVQKGIILQVASNVTQNVRLDIGSVSESIEVIGNAAMVETKDNSIGQVIESQKIVDLPLNGRNPMQLLFMQGSGSNSLPQGSDLTGSKYMGGSNGSGTFSVAGSQANGINYLLDGGDNNDQFANINLPFPDPDAIEEFNVQTNGLPAQYGFHPGGVVNIVTKSGTNALHGVLFEFLRNGDLNARQEGTLARDTLKRSQFGGHVGGRIIKDKLFYFGGFQGTRIRSDPAVNIAYTPTAATLKGDFSVVDGSTANGGCLGTARALKNAAGVPYPNNQIPVSTFDPAGFKLASTYLPLSADPCGKTLFGYPAANPDSQWIGRVDYMISPKHAIFGRYFIYDYTAQTLFDGKNALTINTGNQQRSQIMTFGDNYTFTPALVNSFHATFNRRRDDRGVAANMFTPTALGVNMWVNDPNFTAISVSNYSGSGFSIGSGGAPAFFNINTYQMSDDVTYIHGKHQIGFGVDLRRLQCNVENTQYANGTFAFNGSTTGDGMADLSIGRFSNLTDGNPTTMYLRETVFAAYLQDTLRVASRVTLNVGLRWEPYTPIYDNQGRGNQFSWALFNQNVHSAAFPNGPAGLIFSTDPQNTHGKAFTASHLPLFSPRLGVVWDTRGDGRQTVRAAFSLIHDTNILWYPGRWTTNPPYGASATLTSGQFSNPFASYISPSGVTGDPFPSTSTFPLAGNFISVPPNVAPTYVMQWNVSLQRQLSKDWLLSATYLGNATRHLWDSYDVNHAVYTGPSSTTANTNQRRLTYLANPAQGQYYAFIQQTDDGVNAEYHGLLLKAEHRLASHFTILTSFNWSHCISDWDFDGQLASTHYQNQDNRKGERGSCSFDHRLIFNTSVVATSPGFGNSLSKQVTKNWRLSPLVSLTTGQPIMITDGGQDISRTGQLQDRPNVILPDSVIPPTRTVKQWFNQAAFAVQPIGTFGNLGRFALNGPGTIQWDMSLSRRFEFNERLKLDFRSDFFNVMNHGNWSNPTTSISSATFGQIVNFGSPRIIQMGMKLYF